MSEVHIARLGDLFKERFEIIYITISYVAQQIIWTDYWDDAVVKCLQAESAKNVCKTTKRYDVIRIPEIAALLWAIPNQFFDHYS